MFLITGKTKEQLGPWITEIKNLNIFCEFGYLIRLKRTNEWIRLYEPKDWSWKETSRKIMEIYVNNTEGSDIEIKESSIVWKYGNVNEEFGSKQADQLESHLKTILGYLKEIEISRGKYYVEVRPYGLNKVKNIIYLYLKNL